MADPSFRILSRSVHTSPPLWKELDKALETPAGSIVLREQRRMREVTRATLAAFAADMRTGLLETVGIGSALVEQERTSLIIELPPETDTKAIASAVDLENVEAWCDERGQVHLAISPWFSTKDVDQAVLSVVKVVHVLLGLHADSQAQPKSVWSRMVTSMAEIITLEKEASQKKD